LIKNTVGIAAHRPMKFMKQ